MRVVSALIFSNIWIAAGAGALTLASARLAGGDPVEVGALGAMVFWATLAVYSLDRWVGGRGEDRLVGSVRHRWLSGHRGVVTALIGIGIAGSAVSALMLRLPTILALVPLGVVSVGYSLPLIFWKGARLKDLPGLKTPATALVWAVVTCGLPALELGEAMAPGLWVWLVLERALFMYALTLPFDVRDMRSDRAGGVRTLAGRLGEARSFGLAQLAAVAVMGSALVRVVSGMGVGSVAVVLASLASLGLLIYGKRRFAARRPPGELYYGGALDGMILGQALLLLVFG
ncbi:hypothetical protein FRC98_02895 [Lujinxingia vulgaris]|uniref:Prenyltransferase n=1 Tax=Lujinxingia vulgaris TaxID=2600176 RepID=A0A5C6XK88_9DELT|nr:UbiA family prenyltransferase [Lujinxingia vulgaris]TXD39360.1 hypothetical protein FRC98_02895 [Lujinxingia vulgaris]